MRVRIILEVVVVVVVLAAVWFSDESSSESQSFAKWNFNRRAFSQALTNRPISACGTVGTNVGMEATCDYLNGKAGCCTKDPDLAKTFQLLDSTCSNKKCRSIFTAYWCTFSCSVDSGLCKNDLDKFVKDCKPCKNLRDAGYVPTDSKNASTGSNCTSFVYPETSSSVPTITAFTISPSSNSFAFDYASVTATNFTLSYTVQSTSKPKFKIEFRNGGTKYTSKTDKKMKKDSGSSPVTYSGSIIFCQGINQMPAGETIITGVATNSAGDSSSKTPTGVDTLTVTVTGTQGESLGGVDACAAAGCPADSEAASSFVFGKGKGKSKKVDSLSCSCGAECGFVGSPGELLIALLMTLSSAVTKFSKISVTLTSLVLATGAVSMDFTSAFLTLVGAFTMNLPFFTFQGDKNSRLTFEKGSSFRISRGSKLKCLIKMVLKIVAFIIGELISEEALQLVAGGGMTLDANASCTVQSSIVNLTNPIIEMVADTICSGSGKLNIFGGYGKIHGAKQLCRMLTRGNSHKQSNSKLSVLAYSVPAGASKVAWCGNLLSSTQSFDDTTQLLIQTTCVYSLNVGGEQVTSHVSGAASNVDMQSGSYLTFEQITTSTKKLYIEGELIMSTSAHTEALVTATTVFPSAGTKVYLARFLMAGWKSGTAECSVLPPDPVVEGCPSGRSCTVAIEVDGTAYCQLYLNVSGSSSTAAGSTLYISANVYSISLNRDCATFSEVQFKDIMTRIGGVADYVVQVVSRDCGSMTVGYKCQSSTSIAAGDAECAALQAKAQAIGSDLNKELGVVNPSTNEDNTSNNALYALFAVILLPCCCVLIIVWWCKSKQKQADDQFMQDTQTFTQQAAAPKQQAPVYYPQQPQFVAQPQMYAQAPVGQAPVMTTYQ